MPSRISLSGDRRHAAAISPALADERCRHRAAAPGRMKGGTPVSPDQQLPGQQQAQRGDQRPQQRSRRRPAARPSAPARFSSSACSASRVRIGRRRAAAAPRGSSGPLQRGRPAAQHPDLVAEAQRLERVVGHQQHRPPGQQLGRQILQAVAGDRIEGGERLVHQHDGPVLHQRAGQGRRAGACRRTARPAACAPGRASPTRASRASARSRSAAPLGAGRRRAAGARAGRCRRARQPGQQQVLLRHQRDAAVERPAVVGGDQRPGLQAGDQAQERRLADARGPEQAGPAAGLEAEAQVLEQRARRPRRAGGTPRVSPGPASRTVARLEEGLGATAATTDSRAPACRR